MIVDRLTQEWLDFYQADKQAGKLTRIFWRLALFTLPEGVDETDPRVIAAIKDIEKSNQVEELDETPPCHAARDGECLWSECPQLCDGEPNKTGRHCPYDLRDEDDQG